MAGIGPNNAQGSAFLRDLINRRRKLIDGLDANKGEVNLDIFEDFYPDRAHFVYELLQNAEDAGATRVTFTLKPDRLICEHDGRRTFTEADVVSITGIHNSTKNKSPDKIGKFGVGFKSVFVYTQSPTVHSGQFSFRIVQMILPEPIAPDPSVGNQTRFEFPFDNPKKTASEAYAEIAAGLTDLDETTLLFLSNLKGIRWQISGKEHGEVLRHEHSDFHFEVLKQAGDKTTSSSHLLKFDQAVSGLETHRVAVAFPLDFLPGVRQFDKGKQLVEQFKIVAAPQGRVAVFFVAAKETSGLSFHLHGPFVPELSRASIKETAANEPLFDQLAALCAKSLHKIRDLGLLTPEFLAILPNPQDQLPLRYQPIRSAIIAEMNTQALTPTHARGHAEAKRLIQAKASLKQLLSTEDIEFLVEYDNTPPLWAIGVTQKNNRIDNFLGGLDIQDWGIDEFIETFKRATAGGRYIQVAPYFVRGPDQEFMRWLAGKPPEWLQQFYALLHDEAAQAGHSHVLKGLKIVRLDDGTFSTAGDCFFASDHSGDGISTVDPQVYTSGRAKPQQEKAKKLLSDLGVRELGEAEEIELILKARYTKEAEIPDDRTYLRDLKRFVTLVEQQPGKAKLFATHYIFQGEDDDWHTPESIYLDQPYKLTDLSAYYGRLGDDADCVALHKRYRDHSIAIKRFRIFCEAVGVKTELKIRKGSCSDNPEWASLRRVGGDRYTSPIDADYYLPHLPKLLETPSLELSRLIWRTLTSLSSETYYLRAVYRRNQSGGTNYADSRLVHDLRAACWVPQSNGTFVRPADASRELLPHGFPYDAGSPGIEAVQFGVTARRQSAEAREKDTAAKSLGFTDAAAAERARRFNELPIAEQEKILEGLDDRNKSALPDREPANPERRAQRVREQAMKAPNKETEVRERSVSIGREEVKEHAEVYLRERYRNADGEMTCQICKGPLPFKLDDGREYFEVVEFLPELTKRHLQNYIALCPNHSAMFRLVNASKDTLRDEFRGLSGNEISVVLAEHELTVYFSKTHVIDLKAVLDAEAAVNATSADDADAKVLADIV